MIINEENMFKKKNRKMIKHVLNFTLQFLVTLPYKISVEYIVKPKELFL